MSEDAWIDALGFRRVAVSRALVFTLFCNTAWQTGAIAAQRPDTLATLTARKAALEGELAKVNGLIEKASNIESPSTDAVPTQNHFVEDFGVWDVDAVGGVSAYMKIVNPNSGSALKYAKFSLRLYNRVGDTLSSSIGGETTTGITYTGPLDAGTPAKELRWDPLWYNHSGACIKILSMSVEFMNGKRQSYSGTALRAAMSPRLTNDCRSGANRYTDE